MSEISSVQSFNLLDPNMKKYKNIKKKLNLIIILYIISIILTIITEIVCLSISNKKNICKKDDEFNLNYVFGMSVHLSFFILLYILILICLYLTKDELYDYCCSLCNFYLVFIFGFIAIFITIFLICKCKNNVKIIVFSSLKILFYVFLFVLNYIILWYYKFNKLYLRFTNIRTSNNLNNIEFPIILSVNFNGNRERIILYNTINVNNINNVNNNNNNDENNVNSENFNLNFKEEIINLIVSKCDKREFKDFVKENNKKKNKKNKENSKINENNKENCTICLQEFKITDVILILPCKHYFHFDCIKNWFDKNLTCPLDNLSLENLLYQ
jgi:hypothetical protein